MHFGRILSVNPDRYSYVDSSSYNYIVLTDNLRGRELERQGTSDWRMNDKVLPEGIRLWWVSGERQMSSLEWESGRLLPDKLPELTFLFKLLRLTVGMHDLTFCLSKQRHRPTIGGLELSLYGKSLSTSVGHIKDFYRRCIDRAVQL